MTESVGEGSADVLKKRPHQAAACHMCEAPTCGQLLAKVSKGKAMRVSKKTSPKWLPSPRCLCGNVACAFSLTAYNPGPCGAVVGARLEGGWWTAGKRQGMQGGGAKG